MSKVDDIPHLPPLTQKELWSFAGSPICTLVDWRLKYS